MTHLLDTDTCIHLLRGREVTVTNAQRRRPADLAVSAVTHYELLYGVECCPPEWRKKESGKVRALLERIQTLPFTGETAAHAAVVRRALEVEGLGIGPMDVMIAASAIEHDLPLVTSNLREFKRVPGLRCEELVGVIRGQHPMSVYSASDPIAIALAEDLGSGDVTCHYFVAPERRAQARIFAKESAILAGVETAAEVFRRVDPGLAVERVRDDGSSLEYGDTALFVSGHVSSILTAERVALNFLQRLSGVATLTRRFVDAVAGTKARILDTRKTTAGLRALEKAAVRAGGGQNHRFGLFDMAMVKDNHLAAAAGLDQLRAAIAALKRERPKLRLELEADTLEQVEEFLSLDSVDVILLDNMTPNEMREAVRLGAGRVEFEASGGVSLDTVRSIAETGVDFISIGALTHSAPAVDFSLELVE